MNNTSTSQMNTFILATRNTIVTLLLFANPLNSQDINLYKDLGIKEAEEYIFNPIESAGMKDSILINKIFFDSLGRIERRKKTYLKGLVLEYMHYYRDDKLWKIKRKSNRQRGTKIHKAYKYNQEGKLIVRKNYSRGSMRGKEFFKFDSKGRIRERVIKNFTYTKKRKYVYLYNDKGQKVKEHSKNTSQDDLEFEYDENGNEIYTYRIDKERGRVFYFVKEYDDKNRLIKVKTYCNFRFRLPETHVDIFAEKGDIWIQKFDYNDQGLVVTVRQWLNNILVGIKKIHYEFGDSKSSKAG